MKIHLTICVVAIGIVGLLPTSAQPAEGTGWKSNARAASVNAKGLDLNFVNVPLETVLAYFCAAGDFIIVQETHVSGTMTVKGVDLTKNEAVDLLNHELNRNGCTAIRDGRTLTIVDMKNAKAGEIPIKTGYNPEAVPRNDEVAVWIIPIRFVGASQMISVLSPFLSAHATVFANEDGNSIVITDIQSNIRHLTKIIQAVDNTAEAETELRVFRLNYANPTEVADELDSVFPSSDSSGGQVPPMFAGPGADFGLPAVESSETTAGGNQQRILKATQITTVTDSRLQAIIVSAPKSLMTQVAGLITALDVPSVRDQTVGVIRLQNGDPLQVAQVLQNIFSNGNTVDNGASAQTSALQQRQQTGMTTMSQTMTTSSFSSGSGGGQSGSAF